MWEVPIFLLIAVIGGLVGAAFCELNKYISRLRRGMRRPRRVLEALLCTMVTASLGFWLPHAYESCRRMTCNPSNATLHAAGGEALHSSQFQAPLQPCEDLCVVSFGCEGAAKKRADARFPSQVCRTAGVFSRRFVPARTAGIGTLRRNVGSPIQ